MRRNPSRTQLRPMIRRPWEPVFRGMDHRTVVVCGGAIVLVAVQARPVIWAAAVAGAGMRVRFKVPFRRPNEAIMIPARLIFAAS